MLVYLKYIYFRGTYFSLWTACELLSLVVFSTICYSTCHSNHLVLLLAHDQMTDFYKQVEEKQSIFRMAEQAFTA